MKKLFLISIMLIGVLGGCNTQSKNTSNDQHVAVTTSFIEDIVEILDEGVDSIETELIIPRGEDPHIYQPTASDFTKIDNANLTIYQGLHFEGRMEDVLSDGQSITESFRDGHLLNDVEDQSMPDPHFWFDIDLYKEAVKNTRDILSDYHPEHTDEYTKNQELYFKKLDELDEYIQTRIAEIPEESRLLITPHDAFRYMENRYDIEVVAPQGISTASEVSNHALEEMAKLIKEHDINAIFVETTTNPDRMKRLQEIAASKGKDVEVVGLDEEALLSDSLSSESYGHTYIDMYTHNIDTIVNHLKE